LKKDTGKWCEFHKIPWHNTNECHLKQSLLGEIKEKESDYSSNYDSEKDKGKWIIYEKPSGTIATANIQQEIQRSLRRGSSSSIHRCG
jgi:hypothetical protein